MTPDPLAGASLDATLLRAMLDAIPARVVAVDREHRILDVNAEGRAFTRLPRHLIVGQPLANVVGQALYERVYKPLHERIFEKRETVRIEGWVDYPHIGRRYVQEHFFPYSTGAGPVQAAFVFVRDLTELKSHEAELAAKVRALEATESLKAAIVDHAQAAVVVGDAEDRLVEFNPAAEAMFGFTREEALGRPAAEREAYLRKSCPDAASLAEAMSLLASLARAGGFMDSPTQARSKRSARAGLSAGVAGEGAGSVIGRYTLLEQIGEGGFGIVYLANDTSLGRRVALKEYMPTSLAARTEGLRVDAMAQEFTGDGLVATLVAWFGAPSVEGRKT